jgi:hypothetical protein
MHTRLSAAAEFSFGGVSPTGDIAMLQSARARAPKLPINVYECAFARRPGAAASVSIRLARLPPLQAGRGAHVA